MVVHAFVGLWNSRAARDHKGDYGDLKVLTQPDGDGGAAILEPARRLFVLGVDEVSEDVGIGA